MEVKAGRVRNFVVSNVEAFSNIFARTLCKNQVEYLQIENEFHCFDKIFRFYSFEEYMELRDTLSFVGEDEDFIRTIEPISVITSRSEVELSGVFLDDIESVVTVDDYMVETREEKVPTYTKTMMKQSSKRVNDRIKQNSGLEKRIINRKRRDL